MIGGNCSNKDKLHQNPCTLGSLKNVERKKKHSENAKVFFRKAILEHPELDFTVLSTVSSLELAEAKKLSGGAKHIMKPPPKNGDVRQSFRIHYTIY